MDNRNGTLEQVNGTPRPKVAARKAVSRKKPAIERSRLASMRQLELWATRYVAAALVLSACLNAAANVRLCGSELWPAQLAAGILGAVVPGLVWLAGKQAGYAHRAGQERLSWAVGAAGVCLLVLSIYHCSHALAHLTGSGWLLSLLLAVGIDYGLVASEVAAILAHEE